MQKINLLPHLAFPIINDSITVEGIPIDSIAAQISTPFYLYSSSAILKRVRDLKMTFHPLDIGVHFAVKALGNIAILKLLANEGIGADIVSYGEMQRAISGGIAPRSIIFSGVGKTQHELYCALKSGVHMINAESIEELHTINATAKILGGVADVAIRINPHIDAKTNKKITTGTSKSKFGISREMLPSILQDMQKFTNINIIGVACHIGSQIMDIQPLIESYSTLLESAVFLEENGFNITNFDLGGGFGVPYNNTDSQFEISVLVDVIRSLFASRIAKGHKLAIEPGRYLTAESGILVSTVVGIKKTREHTFLVIDAAMNDLMRTALYEAQHAIIPITLNANPVQEYDVVGQVCESSDIFARKCKLQTLKAGDLVAILTAGAYGANMSSMYNSRSLVPEVLAYNGATYIVRKRIDIDEQMSWENIPSALSNNFKRQS